MALLPGAVTNAGERGGRALLQKPINWCLGPLVGLSPIRRRISGDAEVPRHSVFMMVSPSSEEHSLNRERGGGVSGGEWEGRTGTNEANWK